jgi:hypothetical protein
MNNLPNPPNLRLLPSPDDLLSRTDVTDTEAGSPPRAAPAPAHGQPLSDIQLVVSDPKACAITLLSKVKPSSRQDVVGRCGKDQCMASLIESIARTPHERRRTVITRYRIDWRKLELGAERWTRRPRVLSGPLMHLSTPLPLTAYVSPTECLRQVCLTMSHCFRFSCGKTTILFHG